MSDPPVQFDKTTALEVIPGATPDATTVAADSSSASEPSILHDLAPGARTGPGVGSRQLAANYRAILAARAIYYPVAYRFPRELGRGRQGIVFLGLRQGARGCVTRHAIKLFDPAIYSSAKKYWTDMGRIAAQTSKLQLVKNPALVAPDIYEESNGIGYLQMEVVDGISLRELLDGTHLEQVRARSTEEEWRRFTDVIFRLENGKIMIQPGIALYILRQVLRGLETLHEMGFIHSDVKPANIMIDRLGYVKLIDYGRAMLVDEKITLLLGTPVYMAPETHSERVARTYSDLYSLGLVGLEMLRGERLFPADINHSEPDLLKAKRELPTHLYDLLPDHVRKNAQFLILLQRFLEPNPAGRFATAEEAEVGSNGLSRLHKQLTLAGKDTEYGRELENYLSRIVNPLGPA
ncbi:MAG TPA: hypothetical protein DCM68_01275 [Verrucomicrobia bacterium]|nr:hypothetical protein [Verrucomicrobiota bacterium]